MKIYRTMIVTYHKDSYEIRFNQNQFNPQLLPINVRYTSLAFINKKTENRWRTKDGKMVSEKVG